MAQNKSNDSSLSGHMIQGICALIAALIAAYAVLIAADKVPNPFERTSQIGPLAGIWDGNIASTDGSFQTAVVISIQSNCTPRHVCGTYDTPTLGCKGDLIFKGISHDIYEFVENKSSASAEFCRSNGIDRFVLDPDGRLHLTYSYTDAQETLSSSGILTRK
jgi:hypothetical protein